MSSMSPNAAAWRSLRSDRSVVDQRVCLGVERGIQSFEKTCEITLLVVDDVDGLVLG